MAGSGSEICSDFAAASACRIYRVFVDRHQIGQFPRGDLSTSRVFPTVLDTTQNVTALSLYGLSTLHIITVERLLS